MAHAPFAAAFQHGDDAPDTGDFPTLAQTAYRRDAIRRTQTRRPGEAAGQIDHGQGDGELVNPVPLPHGRRGKIDRHTAIRPGQPRFLHGTPDAGPHVVAPCILKPYQGEIRQSRRSERLALHHERLHADMVNAFDTANIHVGFLSLSCHDIGGIIQCEAESFGLGGRLLRVGPADGEIQGTAQRLAGKPVCPEIVFPVGEGFTGNDAAPVMQAHVECSGFGRDHRMTLGTGDRDLQSLLSVG